MNTKQFTLRVCLGFAVAIAGVVSQTTLAQAQSGNQSDVSGVTVTTSDIVGGFNFHGVRSDEVNNRIVTALNSTSVSINQQLQQGSLSIIATDVSQTAISSTIQQNLLVILTNSVNVDQSVTVIVNDLVNAGADVTLSRNLVTSLIGLTASNKISIVRFQSSTRTYNVFIDNCSVIVFENNPDSLRAIRSILAQLLNTTFANASR